MIHHLRNLALPMLLLFAMLPSNATAQCSGATEALPIAGLPGCSGSCQCKWRVTFQEQHTPDHVQPDGTPSLPPLVSGMKRHRKQGAAYGRPWLDMHCKSFYSGLQGSYHNSSLYGLASSGSIRIHIDHIDICSECIQNAIFSGWSNPMTTLTASIKGNASYQITAQLQASFALLSGANNFLRVIESASSNAGYIGQVTGGISVGGSGVSVSGSVGVSGTATPTTQPSSRPYITSWKKDVKMGLSETVTLLGLVNSSATANQPNAFTTNEAKASLYGSVHCAGVRFKCVCDPGSHGGSGTPGPGPGPGPGGTTGGSGQPGGTTPTPGGTTPGGAPGGWRPVPAGTGGTTHGGDAGGEVIDWPPTPAPDPEDDEKPKRPDGPATKPLGEDAVDKNRKLKSEEKPSQNG